MDTKTVGGGQATPLSGNFLDWFSSGLQNGFGSSFNGGGGGNGAVGYNGHPLNFPGAQNTAGSAMMKFGGIGNILDKFLSGDLGDYGKALTSQFNNQSTADVNNIRSYYSMGGTGQGTPGSSAEAMYHAQATPNFLAHLGGLQQQGQEFALGNIFQIMQQVLGIGQPQAQTVSTPSFGANLLGAVTSGIGALGSAGLNIGGGGIPSAGAFPGGQPYIPPPLPTNLPNFNGLSGGGYYA